MARGKAFYSVGAAATKDLPPNYNRYTFPGKGGGILVKLHHLSVSDRQIVSLLILNY